MRHRNGWVYDTFFATGEWKNPVRSGGARLRTLLTAQSLARGMFRWLYAGVHCYRLTLRCRCYWWCKQVGGAAESSGLRADITVGQAGRKRGRCGECWIMPRSRMSTRR
jgi:hypothetical protein